MHHRIPRPQDFCSPNKQMPKFIQTLNKEEWQIFKNPQNVFILLSRTYSHSFSSVSQDKFLMRILWRFRCRSVHPNSFKALELLMAHIKLLATMMRTKKEQDLGQSTNQRYWACKLVLWWNDCNLSEQTARWMKVKQRWRQSPAFFTVKKNARDCPLK